MPYFRTANVNVLLIHIPKTGGSSLEKYFSKKYSIRLNEKSLYGGKYKSTLNLNSSLQHITYRTILKSNHVLGVDFNNLSILTIVRNPYERAISDLFHFKKIETGSTKEEVYTCLTTYIDSKCDNHNVPQHEFLLDESGDIIRDVTIMRTESLTLDMINYGYTDFNKYHNCNKACVNYYDYLNDDSIDLINWIYEKDFLYFDYSML